MKFYLHHLTACQQGGIGWPPIIVRLKEPYKGRKIYGISDSREKRIPAEINLVSLIGNSAIFASPYSHIKNPEWRSQQWCLTWWRKAPKITWDELRKILGIKKLDILQMIDLE